MKATGAQVRPERQADRQAVHDVHAAAFETTAEARLVDALREQATPLVSFVATREGQVVGHILFSPVTAGSSHTPLLLGLAPMAVLPAHQRQGIGSRLVEQGVEACRRLGAGAVVVLGHPQYYGRFGFAPASTFGLSCEFDVPDDVFMALELAPNGLARTDGVVRYHAAFSDL